MIGSSLKQNIVNIYLLYHQVKKKVINIYYYIIQWPLNEKNSLTFQRPNHQLLIMNFSKVWNQLNTISDESYTCNSEHTLCQTWIS